MTERLPESGADLTSQPTLFRFANSVRAIELYLFSETLLELSLSTQPGYWKVMVIDLDGTDDPTPKSIFRQQNPAQANKPCIKP